MFLPALLLLYFLPSRSRRWKNAILLLFSIGFYAWGEPVFVFVMLFSIFLNWLIGLQIEKNGAGKKRWLVLVIAFDVLLIAVFKYASPVLNGIAAATGSGRRFGALPLPIGISFFTFQLMSYVFDVYYGNTRAQKKLSNVALYISLFPQLIAGPIVRYRQIEDQIGSRSESFSDLTEGVRRFVYGLGKKVLLADFLAQIVDNTFDSIGAPSVMTAWLGAIAFTLQIYYDFSGYSDMAIGLGRIFGFRFPENFRYPYIARSITDFWHRWHISLTAWFRDYVYIPLGGNRVRESRWIFNLFFVWLLTGVWHGAKLTFVLWGLLYFLFLLTEKKTGFVQKLGPLSHVYTLVIVTLLFAIFRSDNIAAAGRYVACMFGIGAGGFADAAFTETLRRTAPVVILSVIGATPLLSGVFGALRRRGLVFVEWIWLLLVFFFSILEVVSSTYNPFVYFTF